MTRPICKECGLLPVDSKGTRNGKINWRTNCYKCHGSGSNKLKYIKKKECTVCGFIPKHSCQMDVDHKDGNHKNNNENNLQVLCANCHRLKTLLHRDGIHGYLSGE